MADDHEAGERAVLSHEQVNEVDMDELEGMEEPGLRAHFHSIAERAKANQLLEFLGSAHQSVGEDDKRDLERRFVERRVATVLRLRKARASFDFPE